MGGGLVPASQMEVTESGPNKQLPQSHPGRVPPTQRSRPGSDITAGACTCLRCTLDHVLGRNVLDRHHSSDLSPQDSLEVGKGERKPANLDASPGSTACCVTSEQSLPLSGPPFLHLKEGDCPED